MMALALPFAYMQARAGMVGVKVFLGIMLGIFFHLLNSLFSHIGLLQNWPPFAAAAVPSAAFFLTAVMMMLWGARRLGKIKRGSANPSCSKCPFLSSKVPTTTAPVVATKGAYDKPRR